MVTLRCQGCGRVINFDREQWLDAGKDVTCKECNEQFEVIDSSNDEWEDDN